jgi:hypothetical protein
MHIAFLIQNVLKGLGNLLGTLVWFVSPMTGFHVSLIPANFFFKMQTALFMSRIHLKMASSRQRFVIPIAYNVGECSAFSFPTHTMHKTYLIVEKDGDAFNLHWVNRPSFQTQRGLSQEAALEQIQSMIDERFLFMNIERLLNYPIVASQSQFNGDSQSIGAQGNSNNCPVANLFGTFHVLDILRGEEEITQKRHTAVRQALLRDYSFYQSTFTPFHDSYSTNDTWEEVQRYPNAAI